MMQLAGRSSSTRGGLQTRQHTARQQRRPSLHVCNMFTGIVQGMADVVAVDKLTDLHKLHIRFPEGKLQGISNGASVAINGTCLTVTEVAPAGDQASFDVMKETLRATSLGLLEPGGRVNFERAARVGDEIGGHNVSGHVHCQATVAAVQDSANNRRVAFRLDDAAWIKYVLPKGYIAVDGCSLTIGEVWQDGFSVYLIPETMRVTVFGGRRAGDKVNVEIETQTQAIVDTVERVVERYLQQRAPQEQQQTQQQQQQQPVAV